MKVSAPKQLTVWISVILFVVGFILNFVTVAFLPSGISFWLIAIGYLLLFLGNLLKNF
ncbi:MAG: hypothetical protein JXB38_09395 [Anaerolineales bacterium]|nr:hypothetical protein [Anaerolineales bacterium]